MVGLRLSDNSKTKFRKNHYNTFGLTYGLPKNGGTCCRATSGKGGCLEIRDNYKRETCYMAKVTAIYSRVGKCLAENTAMLVGQTQAAMEKILTITVNNFLEKNKKLPYFRLHYSGDFFNATYAKAWAAVIHRFPQVKFWVYTRSHHLVKYLVKAKNLTIMVSIDPVNAESGYKVYEEFKDKPNVALAWMGDTQPAGYRWVTCPETSGRVKNTPTQGACARCGLCIDNYKSKVKNIQFLIH